MRAVYFNHHGGPEVLRYGERPRPEPGPGQVLLQVEAAAVNFADVMRRRNDPYPFPSPPPFIPGGEVAGRIIELGPGVVAPPVGTPVFATTGHGGSEGYAQFAVADTRQVIPIPPGLTFAEACALVVAGVTAVLTLRDAGALRRGESVLVQAAAGGVGSYAVQLAKHLGAGTVIAAASTEGKRVEALRLGADHAIDYTREGWASAVREVTGGRGADVVLDMAGGQISQESLRALAPFGRMVVYGLASGEGLRVDTQMLIAPSQTVTGFYLGAWFAQRPELAVSALQLLVGKVVAREIQVAIGAELPLAEAAEAHRRLECRETTGKLVLLPWSKEDVS